MSCNQRSTVRVVGTFKSLSKRLQIKSTDDNYTKTQKCHVYFVSL